MIKIRLQRKGRIRRPIYHIVVADSRSPRDGRIIEQVGRFDGVTEKKETILNEDRIMYWLDTGAQPTDSVRKNPSSGRSALQAPLNDVGQK